MKSVIRICVFWGVFAAVFYMIGSPEAVYRWGGLAVACLAENQLIKDGF